MSNMEGMDIRAPIGGLFTVLGVMLAGYGMFGSPSGGAAAGPNVNLWWGLTMLLFGVFMLVLSRRSAARSTPTE